MCGILMCITNKSRNDATEKQVADDRFVLNRRGPDTFSEIEIELSNTLKGTFSGYTLWMQGKSPALQPQVDMSGNILLWNGDVFHSLVDGENIPEGLSDTEFLLKKLDKATTVEEMCNTLESIKGPWSLIYYKKILNVIIAGKDRFGRHSLLWNSQNHENGEFPFPLIISSSSQAGSFCEIPASNLYQISFTNSISVGKVYSRKPYIINRMLLSGNENLPLSILEDKSSEQVLNDYLTNWKKEVDELKTILQESIKLRVQCQPMLCKACVQFHLIKQNNKSDQCCAHSKLAILFSGGLDSTVLAALADRVWPENESIDLFNVAFPLRSKNSPTEKFDVPDRLTGLQALQELQKMNPSRKWNFIEINVELEELLEMRKSRIAALIHPASTVLDDSIGCAQWFAARGEGRLIGYINEKYISPARVVLMGAGADEQLAGYARHRQKFANGGWPSLATEIEMEMNRISERNLGRDNRIIADHGRAPRLPYLDEGVVDYLAQLPIWIKADLRLPVGLGDKIILRALAHSLGLNKTATEPKRAIQFGSRIAKTEARKEKGSQICDRLKKSLAPDN